MDWLGRNTIPCLTHIQVGSAAAQTGKKQVLSETFALCGHNVGHEELKRNYEWMMVRGINLLCQHLEGYSNRGIRKRDYPPAMYIQQPWWAEYKVFNDAMSRVGMLLSEGEIKFDTLLMHNMTSAWICYNNTNNTYNGKDIAYYNSSLINATQALEAKHIPFHLGDETLMERHGRVEGNKLIIGKQTYTKVVLPEYISFMPNTVKLLDEFRKNGGIVTTVDELAPNNIIDNGAITYTCREFDGFTMHYFVNTNNSEQKAKITKGSYAINIETGEKTEFYGEYTFLPYDSLVVIDDGTPCAQKPEEKALKSLDLSGKWNIDSKTMNSLTLDKCTYWFDGELQEENGYILNIAQRANELFHAVDIKCEFKFEAEAIPEKLYLAIETPEIFEIKVNGVAIDKTEHGFFRDSSFRLLDISKYAKLGENTIETFVNFKQSEQIYENLKNAKYFEAERNKLFFDMEIEAMYLVGDFALKCNGSFEPIANEAYWYDGSFCLAAPKAELELANLEQQGYPFFSGEMTFSKEFNLDSTDYKIGFVKRGVNVIKVRVNGQLVKNILWAPYELDLSDYLVVGENTVEITILNNLRNLLGPHHNTEGEMKTVTPGRFFKEPCIWTSYGAVDYTEKYCFVKTGII